MGRPLVATFKVIKPTQAAARSSSAAGIVSQPSSPGSLTTEEKPRIVWEYDQTRLSESGLAPLQEQQALEDAPDQKEAQDALDDFDVEVVVEEEPIPKRPRLHDVVKPIYPDGSRLEYYSMSNDAWVLGTSSFFVLAPRDGEDTPAVRYDIRLGGGQQRANADPGSMRWELAPNEDVDIFSKRNGGEWVPARMTERQSPWRHSGRLHRARGRSWRDDRGPSQPSEATLQPRRARLGLPGYHSGLEARRRLRRTVAHLALIQ